MLASLISPAFEELKQRVSRQQTLRDEALELFRFVQEHQHLCRIYLSLPKCHPIRQTIDRSALELVAARCERHEHTEVPLELSVEIVEAITGQPSGESIGFSAFEDLVHDVHASNPLIRLVSWHSNLYILVDVLHPATESDVVECFAKLGYIVSYAYSKLVPRADDIESLIDRAATRVSDHADLLDERIKASQSSPLADQCERLLEGLMVRREYARDVQRKIAQVRVQFGNFCNPTGRV